MGAWRDVEWEKAVLVTRPPGVVGQAVDLLGGGVLVDFDGEGSRLRRHRSSTRPTIGVGMFLIALARELVTASNCKHQSASGENEHEVEHFTRCVLGRIGLALASPGPK